VVAVTCLLDDKPREFSEEERQILRVVGQRIAVEFDRGKSLAEHARMEERLRENQSRLEEAQHMAHLGSYTGDPTSHRMDWSDELYKIFEMGPAPGGVNLDMVLARAHPDDRALIRKREEDRLSSGGSRFDLEHRLLMPDGRVKYVLVHADVVSGADGRLRTAGTVQDITERKRAEQEREKLREQLALAQTMESIGRLAGGVAHDFNNMLTVILGYASLSKTSLPPDTKLWRNLTEIVKAANRSKEMTQKLLSFSRQQIIAPVPSNLNELVADLLEPLARLIGEDIALAFDPAGDLWTVAVDHSQVNQILLNLVVNARDAMPHGGKLTIETENVNVSEEYCKIQPGAAPGPHVLLAVSDTGVGISEETLMHIFEPFFTTKDVGAGLGLGLSICHRLMVGMQGRIGLTSSPGHGARFTLDWPAPDAVGAQEGKHANTL
jgi:PAS domain S-box-containing protein